MKDGKGILYSQNDKKHYEGEFVKGILKLSSLLEEWKHLASLAEDNEMLDKLKDLQLIREIAVPDSLYLR